MWGQILWGNALWGDSSSSSGSSSGLTQSLSDSFTLSDSLSLGALQPALNLSETLATWTDTLTKLLAVDPSILYFVLSDTITLYEQLIIIRFLGDADIRLDVREPLILTDDVLVAEPRTYSSTDTLSLSDTLALLSPYVIEGYDSLFYGISETLRMTIEQVVRSSDSMSMSDSLAIALIITGINITKSDSFTLTDTLRTLINGILTRSDSFSLSDDLTATMRTLLTTGDVLAFLDTLKIDVSAIPSFSDTFTMSDSAPTVRLSTLLTLSVNDTFPAWTDIVSKGMRGNNVDYLRRALNDRQ